MFMVETLLNIKIVSSLALRFFITIKKKLINSHKYYSRQQFVFYIVLSDTVVKTKIFW